MKLRVVFENFARGWGRTRTAPNYPRRLVTSEREPTKLASYQTTQPTTSIGRRVAHRTRNAHVSSVRHPSAALNIRTTSPSSQPIRSTPVLMSLPPLFAFLLLSHLFLSLSLSLSLSSRFLSFCLSSLPLQLYSMPSMLLRVMRLSTASCLAARAPCNQNDAR